MRSTEDLIRAVRAGDRPAYADLVRAYERAAFATAWKVLREHHLALDAVQSAFVEAYRQLGRLHTPANFGVWILRITHREALRLARQRKRAQSLETAGVAIAVDSHPPGGGNDELLAALGELPEHERLVVSLRYLGGHPVAEVARLTGRPVGTVTKQLSRAIERLRSILREVYT